MRTSRDSNNISFSILMATYNNANYIETAIKSVINQTYLNWELIIVNDASTDNSIKIIEPFLEDKRIQLIILSKNQGVGYAKKVAADNANNDIIGILDADDKLHEMALEVMLKEYQNNPDYGCIYSTMWRCDSMLKNCKVDKLIGVIEPEKTCIFNYKVSHFKTYRKEDYFKTLGYDPNLRAAVDRDIIYKLEEVTNFKYIDKPLYYYRQHQKGVSQGINEYNALYHYYIAKCKAYLRRLDKNLPNLKKEDIILEYYKLKLYKIISFLKPYSRSIEKIIIYLPIKFRFLKGFLKFLKSV